MKTNEWYMGPLILVTSYFGLSIFPEFKLFTIALLSFLFAVLVSRDEWRFGRAVLSVIVPLFVGIVLLFIGAFLFSPLLGISLPTPAQTASGALGFLVLLATCVVAGVPLACAGVLVRRYQVQLILAS